MGTSLIVAYGIGIGVMIILFLIALLTSNNVPFIPGGADVSKRRSIFWIWCALTPIVVFAINMIFYSQIEVPAQAKNYLTASFISAAIALVLFILVGIVIGFSSRGKLQRWPF